MTHRQKLLVHAALSYAHANLDELVAAFAPFDPDDAFNELGGNEGLVEIDGERLEKPTEAEYEELMRTTLAD